MRASERARQSCVGVRESNVPQRWRTGRSVEFHFGAGFKDVVLIARGSGYWPTVAIADNGVLGFDSGEGA